MFKSFGLGLLLVCGLCSVALSRNWVRERADSEQLAAMPFLDELDPADFVGTTMLGGLRPLLVDLLGIRAYDSFTRKDWFDALAVSNLLSRLQPNLPKVWEMNSWNMSYNIAAAKKQAEMPEEEWQWVWNGFEFLKKGIRKNPDSAFLYDWQAKMFVQKGEYEEYAPRFAKLGINPFDEALRSARKAVALEPRQILYQTFLAICLKKKIASQIGLDPTIPVQFESVNPAQLKEVVPLLEEVLVQWRWLAANLSQQDPDLAREREEFLNVRIPFLENVINSAKVSTQQETK